MKITHCKRVLALLLCALTLMSLLPTAAFAGQVDDYHDPAEHWMTSSNRTNQLDVNSVVTQETIHCFNCGKDVQATVWRVPEYTRDGVTALTRNVKYSDGTTMDGQGTGLVNDGTPGVDATYTGYHWTKSSCNYCSTFNCNHLSEYNYGKNVYELYDCAAEFMDDLDETVTYEFVDSTYHRKTTHGGTYCVFCYGTRPRENSVLERHTLHTDIIPQLGHQRFAIVQHCEDCEYTEYEFVAAKSVVADYYGVVDGQPHTLTVSDLSEAGVSTAIRYGNSADSCTLTSAPNYTEEGQYVVYYEITYTYRNTSMTEDGVAYVWLRDERETNTGCSCGCGRSDCDCRHDGCTGSCCDSCGNDHNWTLMEHISATCTELGYDRYVCLDCGKVEKRDYVNAIGHAYQSVVIRDASCETEGKIMETCRNCGDVKVTLTPKGEHQWRTYNVAATCTGPGYTVRECSVCSEQHIENITDPAGHRYVSHVTAPTCTTGGFTLHVCSACGDSYADSYTEATGHFLDDGTVLREPTCTEDGLIEYRCTVCGVTKLEDYGGSGDAHASHTHTTVVKLPALSVSSTVISNVPPVANTAAALSSSGGTGHTYIGTVTAPTCTEMGYTTFTCSRCGDSYRGDYTEATGHAPGDWIVDKAPTTAAEGAKHRECETCHAVLETGSIEKVYLSAITDELGQAVVGDYRVTVTESGTPQAIHDATVTLTDGRITVRLPDGILVDYGKHVNVNVVFTADGNPVKTLNLLLTDKNANVSRGTTDENGNAVLPRDTAVTDGDGKATFGYVDKDGTRQTLTVRIYDFESKRPISGAVLTVRNGKLTVKLPDGTDLDMSDKITIVVTDNRKNAQDEFEIVASNDLGTAESGSTDDSGAVTLPAESKTERHAAYILGYPDGNFGPEKCMTRAEATAIFARLLAAKNGESISAGGVTRFTDVPRDAWYAGYVAYLTKYGVVSGTSATEFSPDVPITRAEFVTLAVRFFDAYGGALDETVRDIPFIDVSDFYWAAEYIEDAAALGWITGYGDGTFRAMNRITRAEVVTIVNRVLGREPDRDRIDAARGLNLFTDMTNKHWAYYDVMEAANTHTALLGKEEAWQR